LLIFQIESILTVVVRIADNFAASPLLRVWIWRNQEHITSHLRNTFVIILYIYHYLKQYFVLSVCFRVGTQLSHYDTNTSDGYISPISMWSDFKSDSNTYSVMYVRCQNTSAYR